MYSVNLFLFILIGTQCRLSIREIISLVGSGKLSADVSLETVFTQCQEWFFWAFSHVSTFGIAMRSKLESLFLFIRTVNIRFIHLIFFFLPCQVLGK